MEFLFPIIVVAAAAAIFFFRWRSRQRRRLYGSPRHDAGMSALMMGMTGASADDNAASLTFHRGATPDSPSEPTSHGLGDGYSPASTDGGGSSDSGSDGGGSGGDSGGGGDGGGGGGGD